MGRTGHGGENARAGLGISALVLGVLGLVLAVGAVAWLRAAYGVSTLAGDSMRPTYTRGTGIVWERVDGGEVRRGDVVVFTPPASYGIGAPLVKRVIGVGGDRVRCCTAVGSREGVSVNGKPVEEPYVYGGDADGVHRAYDVTVPQGRLFLLGDYRADSPDSRFHLDEQSGTVSESAVLGRVTDDRTVPALGVTAALLGGVLVLVSVGLGIGFLVVRRREAAPVPAMPWPAPPMGG
ncbi:signal peptidase I [Streptomyces sp. NPDC004232]|uniref:signal peptidase I n=1 Tax=Streptomyces sp. NPDC004232 TaxID=3154454 RepID=UPI0033AE1F63